MLFAKFIMPEVIPPTAVLVTINLISNQCILHMLPSIPAMLVSNIGMHSVVASHVTSNDGKLLSKSIYSNTSVVEVGNEILLPIKHIGQSSISTHVKLWRLTSVLHVLKLSITCYQLANSAMKTTAV